MTYVMHYIALPWKLIFATIPPTTICGGYLAFFCSLLYIGLLTAVIGASHRVVVAHGLRSDAQ